MGLFEDNGENYRHEYKYLLGFEQAYPLAQRLSRVMKFDKHAPANGMYVISSVYFDSHENSDLLASENGNERRKKFRIRAYNHDDSFINLEIKEKNRYLCTKRSIKINRDIYDEILYGDPGVLKRLENEVADEFYYMIKHRGYRPKTVVQYDRRAFIYDVSNVRITIDRNIKGSGHGFDMFSELHAPISVVSPLTPVLEVKYDRFLPRHIAAMLPSQVMPRQSVSKYVYARTYK